MKRYNGIFGIITMLMLVASFVLPVNMATPSPVSAGTMEWTIVNTPDSTSPASNQIYSPVSGTEQGSEIIKLLVGNNGTTMYAVVRNGYMSGSNVGNIILMKSTNGGQSWGTSQHNNLARDRGTTPGATTVFDAAIAPDDPNLIIVACSTKPAGGTFSWTQEVWISQDGGTFWQNTQWPPAGVTAGTDIISALDISMDFGQGRYLLVGTRDNAVDSNDLQTMRVPGYGGWRIQTFSAATSGDVIAAKFSPTFIGDATIAVVFSNADATYLTYGFMDLFANTTDWTIYVPVELKDSTELVNDSPDIDEIMNADIEMPSDFSGQTASLRRAYVSTSVYPTAATPAHGIYRVDDNTIYCLMKNSDVANKAIWSIAYWGTYASGKLLAGEMLGDTCVASVPVWFTDSPTVCPIPCWYPAKKPPTGAAGTAQCAPNMKGWGLAYVVWAPTYADQGVAYAVTASLPMGPWGAPSGTPPQADAPPAAVGTWPNGLIATPVPLDESAFSLTRNNGATWNQLSLIDTRMAKLTDVAVSPDCTTMYLASVNNETACRGFDSVWRTSMNEKVVAPPLPALPLGSVWERVLTHVTAAVCNQTQSDYAILRLAQDKLDGQVVFWAAGGSNSEDFSKCNGTTFVTNANTNAVEWSPDFGDFWGDIRPRIAVQDMAAPTSTVLYVVASDGTLQKLPYTGTAWSSAQPTVTAIPVGAHTIEAYDENNLIVGGGAPQSGVWFSANGGAAFAPFTVNPAPNAVDAGMHVLFDTDFASNKTVYAASDTSVGRITRNKTTSNTAPWTDMMQLCGAHMPGYYGLAQTNSKNVSGQGTLYGAHAPTGTCENLTAACADTVQELNYPNDVHGWSGVERALRPLDGVPKPCIEWDCLDASWTFYQRQNPPVWFTLEPESLKLCGCLTQDTNATLYAIDNDWYASNQSVAMNLGGVQKLRDRGMLWEYTDCVAKTGPKLLLQDAAIIGCDPATGRNQEVNFTWEQLCIATAYELHITKDKKMTLPVFLSGVFTPYDVTSPALIYLSGGEGLGGVEYGALKGIPSLECGHTYYWWVRVRNEATCDWVRSPWSEVRSFTIKAGFKVTTPYYGPQLLAPDNGCGCPCSQPVNFSWSPFKETTTYKFELSENADMSSPIVSTNVKGTAYSWKGPAKCSQTYFWRVMAVEPAPSEWSATFSFVTQAAPPPPEPPAPPPETPFWVWVVIAIGAILVIVTLVLIFKTRRV